MICTISPDRISSSLACALVKSYSTLAVAFFGAGGLAGGGGGGALIDPDEGVRAWDAATAATGCGTGRGAGAGAGRGAGAAWGVGWGIGWRAGAGRDASFDGPPPGPPGRSSFPLVTGRAATCFPRGVGLDTELGGSPALVWIVWLLYVSTRPTFGSLTAFTTASLPGFLLYSMLSEIFRLNCPRNALVRWVKNSVLKTQFRRGSGSCAPITNENQSSFRLDVLTDLIAPMGTVRSEEICSWLLTMFCATMYTCRGV